MTSESEKEKVVQQKEEAEQKNKELEQAVVQEKCRYDRLRDQMSELQEKYETLTKYLPVSNVFTTLALWKKAVENNKEIEVLKSNCSEKEMKISQINNDLAKSLESCGLLYNKKAELEHAVAGLHKKLENQEFSFSELKRR